MDRKQECSKWFRRVEEAQAVRKQFQSEWEDNYKAVYGDDWMKDGRRQSEDSNTTGKSKSKTYKFDLLLSFLKTEIPSLVLYRPEIFLTATEKYADSNPEAESEAKAYQSEVNTVLNDMDGFEYEIKAILADAHCAWGISKVINEPLLVPNPDKGKEVAIDPETGAPILATDEVLKYVFFDMQRVDPFKYLIDSRCKNDPGKARWKGEEIDRTLEELQDSGLYDAKILNKIKENHKDKEKDDWEIEVKIYELYDRIAGKIIALAEDYQDDFLRYDDTPDGIEGDPYCELKFTEIPGQVIPKSEITSGKQLQEDQRDVRQWLKNLARKNIPKLGVKPDRLDPTEEAKLVDGISDVVKISNENDVFLINNDLKLGTSTKEFMEVGIADFDQVMGQSSQDRGLTGTAKFATEAQIAEQQGKVRESDKLNTTKVWLERNIEKLIMQMKYSGYAELKALPLDTDLSIEIDIESKSPKNKALDRKQLTEALTVIANNPLFIQSPTLLDQIFRDYDIREHQKIIEELQAAIQAQTEAAQPPPAEPQKPGMNLSLSLKHELLPTGAVDKIVDMIMNADIPINPAASSTQPPFEAERGGLTRPRPAESIAAGTEGMDAGSGMMPSGEIV